MFGFNYVKFDSMDYAIHYQNGEVKRKGPGLSFFYFLANSSLVSIPIKSIDLPFIFEEITSDYQEVRVQGQITFRISDPQSLAKHMDFTVNHRLGRMTDDYEKLKYRLVNEAQASISGYVNSWKIREILSKHSEIGDAIKKGMSDATTVKNLGVEILAVNVISVKANPEMIRALEARTREGIQQEADEAIYDRRNFAVEQERKIKESELNTEIAVEQKQKQIVEKKMETDVVKRENDRKLKEMELETALAVEEGSRELVEMEVDRERKKGRVKAEIMTTMMKSLENIDWRTISSLQGTDTDAKFEIAMAFHELANNAEKIGTLNITPELLSTLLNDKAEDHVREGDNS